MKKTITASLLLSTLALSGTLHAADNEAVIKHRVGVMEAIGGHFGAAFSSMRGMPQFNSNQVFHAESVARLATIAKDIFPEGSDKGKTKAKAAIWEQPEDFNKLMDDFILKAEAFATAAKANDLKAYGAAAKDLGGACKACHDDFKKK